MAGQLTDPEFDSFSWHDNTIYGLTIDVGSPEAGDWHADLMLDIDHITEWICSEDGHCRFKVAPATLTFHDVTDLRVAVDCGDSGCRMALHSWSIGAITRERVANQQVCLDRPYYRWRIALNWPQDGEIAFGSSGFDQLLRAEPVETDDQCLPAQIRRSGRAVGET